MKADIRVISKPYLISFECPYCEQEVDIGYTNFCSQAGEMCDWTYSKFRCPDCLEEIEIGNIEE